ncbi:MAG: cutinase family protein, partial [Candidatus Nanopelagicales bacterium]
MGVGVDFIATMLPEGAIEKQNTAAPANGVELSTNPACAATMLIAVPGTFETSRDYNPGTPIGQLAKLAEPLKSVGSATFINYDADYSVNGTSYVKSVEGGIGKTLATIQDAATRCPQARFLLAGFSQGAQIAGDVAVAIGHKRTSVDPSRVLGVALYSDPKRAVDSNVLVDTTQTRPSLPLSQATPTTTDANPSLAQLQLQNTNGFTSLAGQTGVLAAGISATAMTSTLAGQAATTTSNVAGVTTSHVASGTESASRTTGPALPFPAAVAGATTTTSQRPAGTTGTTTNVSAGATTSRPVNDGGLSAAYSNSLTTPTAKPAVNTDPAARVDVPELTLRAVSGGGIERARSENFGELTGRVAEYCVAGDTICSLPANSMLAQAVVKLTDNLSVDLNEIKTSDGGLGMAGIMGIQAINTVADVFGLPHTKLSSTTLVALGKLAVGTIMTSTGNVAGAALIADATSA